MIEQIIFVICFGFLGFSSLYLGIGWLNAEKRHKSEIAILEQDNNALLKECIRLQKRELFFKNELETKE